MQVKLKFSLFVLLAACLLAVKVNAQDESQPTPEVHELNQQHPELNLNDDKTLLIEVDGKAPKTQTATHEVGSGAVNKNNSAKPSSSEKTEEDPLSFNFLYFMIQKFKISDIVDD